MAPLEKRGALVEDERRASLPRHLCAKVLTLMKVHLVTRTGAALMQCGLNPLVHRIGLSGGDRAGTIAQNHPQQEVFLARQQPQSLDGLHRKLRFAPAPDYLHLLDPA